MTRCCASTPTGRWSGCVRIEFEGGYLDDPTEADIPTLVRLLNDPVIERNTLRMPSPYRHRDAEEFLRFNREMSAAAGRRCIHAIRDRHGVLMGMVGVEPGCTPHTAEIGYWVGRPFWNRGVASAAVAAALKDARTHGVREVCACVYTFNPASMRVLERNGFVRASPTAVTKMKKGKAIPAYLYRWIAPPRSS